MIKYLTINNLESIFNSESRSKLKKDRNEIFKDLKNSNI